MEKQAILDELLAILEKNGIKIRTESLGGAGGGLCKIKGEYIFFVDTQGSTAEIAAAAGKAVAQLIDIEGIYLKPQLREFIQTQAKQD